MYIIDAYGWFKQTQAFHVRKELSWCVVMQITIVSKVNWVDRHVQEALFDFSLNQLHLSTRNVT